MCLQPRPFFATPALPLRSWLHAELRQLADELALPAVASLRDGADSGPGGAGDAPAHHNHPAARRRRSPLRWRTRQAPDADLAAGT